MSPAISLRGLRKSFGREPRHPVLDDIDLDIDAGSVFALLGPNGAGKTTLVSILSTLVQPDAGTALVAGFDVVRDPREVKRRISVTGQSSAVDARLTGAENLRMMARLSGLSAVGARRRSDELLEEFDLTEAARRPVASYSGGMRRRLDLALSLVVPTPVLFLDEPTTGLDTRSRRTLWSVVRALSDAGTTVLLTTQYLEEADELADRVAVLHEGRIVADGTATALKARIGGEVVTVTDAAGTLLREVPTDGTPAGLRAALDLLDLETAAGTLPAGTIGLRAPSLDDVFLALTTPLPDTRKALR